MSRGGLDRDMALRAITLSAAEVLGVAERIGSLEPGKDADFVVFNGHPLELGSAVVTTWVDGELAFEAYESTAVVVEVEELHVGDGAVLSPGELLLVDGKVAEVGRKVGRPSGARTVRGKAAMPGIVDALGHLGLEGSTRVPPTRFELDRLVEPGDLADRRVAKNGVTTVVLSPRGVSRTGAPMMAYKPAGEDVDAMVVADPVGLRFQWTDRNRAKSGEALRETLAKAADYDKKWKEYETKKAAWTPPKEEPPKEGEKKEGDAKKDGEAEKKDEAKKDEAKKEDGEKKDEEKGGKKKKGEEKPKPVTGEWVTKITLPPNPEARLRLYVKEDEDGSIRGTLRCAVLSDELVHVSGKRVEKKVTLSGEGTKGMIELEVDALDGKMKGKLSLAGTKLDVEIPQTSTEYETAARPEKRKPAEEPKKEIKGEPKAPGVDPELEPLRRAMRGDAGIVVQVEREDEIRACVDAFAAVGIKPILYGASEAWKVIDALEGRVAGVLLTQRVVEVDWEQGAKKRNRYQELVNAGIPVAFHSAAEEGAADLPVMAAYAVSQGMSPQAALRALTSDAANMFGIGDRVGRLAPGFDGDVVLLDGSPLDPSSSVLRVWVQGREVR
jgi:imidazolonepropionase-like amidohydrolase